MATGNVALHSTHCLGAIYYHEDCTGHHLPYHPEKPARATTILSSLRSVYKSSYFRLAQEVTQHQLLLFHETRQIKHFEKLCRRAEASGKTFAIDDDTEVMKNTGRAVYKAAGALVGAVDALFLPSNHPLRIETAFCCTRPPGHHAEPARAMGFCFFNNAAIAARHAQNAYGHTGLQRVAVVDFDVHHGNGTEEGFRDDCTMFYGSTHELGNFPGTGPEPEQWGDEEESVRELLSRLAEERGGGYQGPRSLNGLTRLLYQGTQEGFNAVIEAETASVARTRGTSLEETEVPDADVPSTALDVVNDQRRVGRDECSRRIVNREITPGRLSRREFRRGWVDVVLEMLRFQPHLVIISAGFDAHCNDPLADCLLTAGDFHWATALVVEACRLCSSTVGPREEAAGCPVLSTLEGGYDLPAIAESTVEHVRALFVGKEVSESDCEGEGEGVGDDGDSDSDSEGEGVGDGDRCGVCNDSDREGEGVGDDGDSDSDSEGEGVGDGDRCGVGSGREGGGDSEDNGDEGDEMAYDEITDDDMAQMMEALIIDAGANGDDPGVSDH